MTIPIFQLEAARRRRRQALEACPHWDYASDGCGHPCCDEVAAAERALEAARKRMKRTTKR